MTLTRGEDGNVNCEMCKYVTDKISHMRRHIAVVHMGVKRYPCKLCNNKYSSASPLRMHMKTVHNIVRDDEPVKVNMPNLRKVNMPSQKNLAPSMLIMATARVHSIYFRERTWPNTTRKRKTKSGSVLSVTSSPRSVTTW